MTRLTVTRSFAALLFLALSSAPSLGAEPLSIEAAYAAVRTASEAVRAGQLGVEKSRAQFTQAASHALPHLSLEATGAYMTNPPTITVNKGEFGTIDTPLGPITLPEKDIQFSQQAENTYFKIDATLSQPLFTWGKIAGAIKLATLEIEAAGSALRKQERDSEKDVHTAYFGALLAEQSAAVLTGMRETLQNILDERRKSFEDGSITRQSVLEAEANLASLDKKLVDAEENRQTAYESLAMLTGLDAKTIGLATSFRAELPVFDEDSLKAAALAGSADVQIGRTRLNQARTKLDIEKGGAALLPDFTFVTTAELTGGKIPFLGTNWTDTWNLNILIGIGTKVNVIDAGESRGRIGAAQKDLETASQGLSGAEKQVQIAVRKAVQQARSAAAETREKSARLAFVEEQAKNARVSFDNGLATREELDSGELALAQARLEDLLARYDLEAAIEELEYQSGMSFPR